MSVPQRRLIVWAAIAIIIIFTAGDGRLMAHAFTSPLLSPVFRTIGVGCRTATTTRTKTKTKTPKQESSQSAVLLFTSTFQSTTSQQSSVSLSINDDAFARKEYESWRQKFNKGEFNAVKFEIFKKNYNAFALVNMISKRDGVSGAKILDLNEYADMSMSEYEAMVMSLNGSGGGHVVSRRMDTTGSGTRRNSGGDNLSSIERAAMASRETAKLVEKYGLDDPEDLEAVLDAMAGNAEMVGGKFNPKNIAREARIRTAYISWCSYYDKVPSEARFPNFSRNYMDMEEYARKSHVEMELNEYADCSEEELGYDDTTHGVGGGIRDYGANGVMIDGMFNVPQRVKGNEEEERMWDIYCTWCKSFKKIPDENRFVVFMANYRQLDTYARENNIELELAEYADCTEEEYIRRKREDQLGVGADTGVGVGADTGAGDNKAFFDPHEHFMDRLRDAPGHRRASHAVSRSGKTQSYRSALPPWRENARFDDYHHHQNHQHHQHHQNHHPQQRRPSPPQINNTSARQKRLLDAKAQSDLQIAARKEATLKEQKKAAEEFAMRQAQKAAELQARKQEEEAKRAEGRRKAREEAEARKRALDEAKAKQEQEAKEKADQLAKQREQAQKELQQRRDAMQKEQQEQMARVQREASERAKQRAEALEQRRLQERAKQEEEQEEKSKRRAQLEQRRQRDYEARKRKEEERREELKRMKEERELAEEMMKRDYLMRREEMKDGIRRKMRNDLKGNGLQQRTRDTARQVKTSPTTPTPNQNMNIKLDKDETLEDTESRVRQAYEQWCDKYDRIPEESRFTIFLSNYLQMEDYSQTDGTPLRLNRYADRTQEEYAAITNDYEDDDDDDDDNMSFSMPPNRRMPQESSSPRPTQQRRSSQRQSQRSKNADAYEQAERKAKQLEFQMKQREAQETRGRMTSRDNTPDEDYDNPRTNRRNNVAVRDRRSDNDTLNSSRPSQRKPIIPPRQQQSSSQTAKINRLIQSKQNDAALSIRNAKRATAAAKSFTLQAKKSRDIAMNTKKSSKERNKAAEDAKRNARQAERKMEEARVLMEEAMMVGE